MPRKAKNSDDKINEQKKKKTLMNTIVKDIKVIDNEDIILQLPISESVIENSETDNVDSLPKPYEPDCFYIDSNDNINNIVDNANIDDYLLNNEYNKNNLNSTNNCYWCCHPIEKRSYGMPYKYNIKTNSYVLYGNFCSLECANAYNFSSHNGSDKVWEINSYIQMLSKHYGCVKPIRPAPSRYLLKMFNGPLTIDEFRKSHVTCDKTHILNLPPMISTNYNYEIVNTSYIKNITDNINNCNFTMKNKK